MSNASQEMVRLLKRENGLTHGDLVARSHFSSRTVRYALSILKKQNLLVERANLKDMRKIVYHYRESA